MMPTVEISWPEHYDPRNCPIHVRNDIEIDVAPDAVWAWITRAPLWPTWYRNSADVRILQGDACELRLGTRFRWKTFGVAITSTVIEYVPNGRMAWDAHGLGVDAYHAWALAPCTRGCYVLTEETQHGWAARLGGLLMPGRMHRYHQVWLESLAAKARGGLPPPA